MPGPVEMTELPDCDICKVHEREVPNKATGDSQTTYGRWGYTCDEHAHDRVGEVTILVLKP